MRTTTIVWVTPCYAVLPLPVYEHLRWGVTCSGITRTWPEVVSVTIVWPQETQEREKRNLETTSELSEAEDYSDIMVAHPQIHRDSLPTSTQQISPNNNHDRLVRFQQQSTAVFRPSKHQLHLETYHKHYHGIIIYHFYRQCSITGEEFHEQLEQLGW